MTWQQLITASKMHLRQTPIANSGAHALAGNPGTLFSSGAHWMHRQLAALHPTTTPPFNPNTQYTAYGLLKYGACLTALITTLTAFPTCGPIIIPLSILAFYLVEIHFLFLFPILIDQTPNPVLSSIRATYKIGIARCLLTVIPIAAYMLIGLLNKKHRLHNWYIGCLAIIIWYNHETRTRL